MANNQPFQVLEIDVDYCSRTFGVGGCTASLSSQVTDKCHNTYATCPLANKQTVFLKEVKTLRYCNNRSNTPVGFEAYPRLQNVSVFTSTVNIAGATESQGAFGRRGTVSATIQDFPDNDVFFDKYVRERQSGAAQFGGVGYNPVEFGTHFTKLKARWPFYANRPMRILDGYLDDTGFVVEKTRHFIITNFKINDAGLVTIEGKDVLALADDKKALAPKPSRGKLLTDITADAGISFTLDPAGIGVEYPTSGYANIRSEVVQYTRSGDVITLTARGLEGTIADSQSAGDSFQDSIFLDGTRVDDFVENLLVNYAKVDPSFCPKTTKWAPLITRWMASTRLTTVITKPTGVAQLLGELAALGVSIWWDDVQQEILIQPNTPVEETQIRDISDEYNILKISEEDRDEDRLTQIHFYSKQIDPTKDYKDKSNYAEVSVLADAGAESTLAYNDTKVREIFCRFFNRGADSAIRVISLRLLKRFNTAPSHYAIKLDNRDGDLSLTDVIRVNTRILSSATGRTRTQLLQVFRKSESNNQGSFDVSAQAFLFEGRFGYCMPNGSPTYATATDEQKRTGNFAVSGSTLLFPDGSVPYEAI